jgi:hypothetical protein
MQLIDWAAHPLESGPPIPLTTDVVNSSNRAYRVGAIPSSALAEDLTAARLTYSPGRGNGYRRHGERIDSYFVGEIIAEIFADAADTLRRFLDTDPVMCRVADYEDALAAVPFRDSPEYSAERRRIIRQIETAESGHTVTRRDLELAAQSLTATSRSVRGIEYVRREAIRRFRSVLPPPPLTPPTMSVDDFLASVPPGPIARPDLHAAALTAGLEVGSRTLYAAADALGWPSANRRGVRRYRVPTIP